LWASQPPSPAPATYKLIKTEKQISLSSREIALKDGRTTRELKAEFIIAATPDHLLKVLKDDKLTRQWMQGLEDYSIISSETPINWKAYVQYNIPWPLSNQDCVISYHCIRLGNSYTIRMSGLPNYIPKKDGVERISHLSGCWVLSPLTNTKSKVVYTVYSEQKPRFPRWATDPIIQQNLIGSMAALREVALSCE